MKKLTAEVARMELANLKAMKENPSFGISIKAELFMQALEIALPVLEQKEKDEVDFRRMGDLLKKDQSYTTPQIDNDGWIDWDGMGGLSNRG